MDGGDRSGLAVDADALARRGLDPMAVAAASRRLARAGTAPWLHQEVGRRLLEHLAPLRLAPTRVLDWWAGAAGVAPLLAARFPQAEVVAVDADAGWSVPQASRVRGWWRALVGAAPTRLAEEAESLLGPAQLVVANMVLHGVFDVPALFARWHRLLEPGGVVAFAALGPGSLGELRELYATAGWGRPSPSFTDMHDLGDMLVEAGFADPVLDQETIAVTWADPQALLDDLRRLGGNAAPDRFAGCRTPRWRDRLHDALRRGADPSGRIALSFEVAYGHGFRTTPRQAAGAPATLSVESVRAQLPSRRSGRAGFPLKSHALSWPHR